MAYTDDLALLTAARDALDHILGGSTQSYQVGTRKVDYLQVKWLEGFIARYERKTAPQAVRSGRALARFRRASP